MADTHYSAGLRIPGTDYKTDREGASGAGGLGFVGDQEAVEVREIDGCLGISYRDWQSLRLKVAEWTAQA